MNNDHLIPDTDARIFKEDDQEDIHIDTNHPRADTFLNIVTQLRGVDWRSRKDKLKSAVCAICAMIEKGLYDDDILKGQLVMYCEGGKLYRAMFKHLSKQYCIAGGVELRLSCSTKTNSSFFKKLLG